MQDTSESCSDEQQSAEGIIADIVESRVQCKLDRNVRVDISDGVHIEPDLYSEKDRIICEIFAHIGSLKVGQQHKISQDLLKMLLLEKSKGVEYRKAIVIVDDSVEKYLNGKSFIAESIRQFGIEVIRINLPDEISEGIQKAQKRQVMINA